MSVVTASDEMPYALNFLARRNSGDLLCPRQLIGSVTMAANVIDDVLGDPNATRAAVEELYNFKRLCIFGPKGAIQIRYYYYYYYYYYYDIS